ncbi:hypothetical protein [Microvirga massiliensis]|uniref:hypothetical protein n=1 Tax=Microvirga massiliensis TaxID=1033741 RepID=UPI00062BE5DA|nr:hypothetical protein [Microvirga massiliensis]
MKSLTPFANDTESQNIGGLTFENGSDRIVISGDLEITKDQAGLKRAKALQTLLGKIVKALQAEEDLPEKIEETTEPAREVPNPFETGS